MLPSASYRVDDERFAAGTKRGLVTRRCAHALLFAPQARRWWYNHAADLALSEVDAKWRPNTGWNTDVRCRHVAASAGHFLYVPMIESLRTLSARVDRLLLDSHSRWLLGMNEPAGNQTAHAVAKRWGEVEAIANHFSPPLKLGSPAPGGLQLKQGERWLRDFFQACRGLAHGCRVDALALHFYECDGSSAASAEASADAMMAFLSAMHQRYRKRIWLTEFNCGDGDSRSNPLANQSEANHLRFMRAALPRLERAPFVERYSWFQAWQLHMPPAFNGQNPGCSLITRDGTSLTELGRFYSSFHI